MVLVAGEDGVGQPAYQRGLVEAGFGLKEFQAMADAAVLVLPAAPCSEELF